MTDRDASAFHWLIGCALVVLFLRLAAVIVLPIVVALFLAMLLMPLVGWFERRRIPRLAGISLALAVATGGLALLATLLTASLASLKGDLPFYADQLRHLTGAALAWLDRLDIGLDTGSLTGEIDAAMIGRFVGQGMISFVGLATNLVLIFFLTLFLMLEAARFRQKAQAVYGESTGLAESFAGIGRDIQSYLLWKTVISLGTGLLVWLFLALLGVDFALLWGLLTFLLNYIPNIGSIVATIPPVLVALLRFDQSPALAGVTLLGLTFIQMTIGNLVEPRLLGRELNLSPLVVFLSMLFWGWMWGVAGMLLAVPLMVCLKTVLVRGGRFTRFARMMEE